MSGGTLQHFLKFKIKTATFKLKLQIDEIDTT